MPGGAGAGGGAGDGGPVFVLSQGAVSQNTQYFGAGTRLTVLGERGARRGRGLPDRGPGAPLCSLCPVLRGRQPADRPG